MWTPFPRQRPRKGVHKDGARPLVVCPYGVFASPVAVGPRTMLFTAPLITFWLAFTCTVPVEDAAPSPTQMPVVPATGLPGKEIWLLVTTSCWLPPERLKYVQ